MPSKENYAIRIHRFGGPEEMRWEPVEVGDPGPGEARIRHTAVGVNFVDTLVRKGLHGFAPPVVIGREAAGVVEAVGPGVANVKAGDRVGYAPVQGSYCHARLIEADKLVKIPAGIDDRSAAAIMLQGMTVQYLIRQIYPVKAGDTVLMHAAAGGVGLFLCQWAAALGARVIGTVSTEEKAALARAHGCHDTIIYTREDFVARVNELTGGRKADVVYDAVGKDTFIKSLDCLRGHGHIVSFGQASGPPPALDVGLLTAKGSLSATGGALLNYVRNPEELNNVAQDMFAAVLSGKVKVVINQEYPLAEAARAHRDLEGRNTTGKIILVV